MKYIADVHVMPQREILDPKGKATLLGLKQLEFQAIEDVRIGRKIELTIDAPSVEAAKSIAEEAARKLLANLIMETFTVSVRADS
jgi:phosphoribosylformylglycinamidine synthase